jgi:hypothetical protein
VSRCWVLSAKEWERPEEEEKASGALTLVTEISGLSRSGNSFIDPLKCRNKNKESEVLGLFSVT